MSFGTSLLYIESLIIFQHVLFAEENLPTIALECHFQIVFNYLQKVLVVLIKRSDYLYHVHLKSIRFNLM